MKKRVVLMVTVEGDIDLFVVVKERIRAIEISETGGRVKVIGIRNQKVEKRMM